MTFFCVIKNSFGFRFIVKGNMMLLCIWQSGKHNLYNIVLLKKYQQGRWSKLYQTETTS